MTVTVRPATESDFPSLTRLDLTYPTDRILVLERSGEPPEHTFTLRWRNRVPAPMAVYATYTIDRLHEAIKLADLFNVAEADGELAGLLMIVVSECTDAAEVTDLAVDIAFRRMGAGRALVESAVEWARARRQRALWVEPRADNHAAISFYTSVGFRVTGFNDRMYSNADHEAGRTTVFMNLDLG